jgi:hypothetical protein
MAWAATIAPSRVPPASQTQVPGTGPLTSRGPDGVLAALMASLTGESEEGMWYASDRHSAPILTHGCPRNCKRRAFARCH